MRRFLSILFLLLSSICLLCSIYFVVSEREHVKYSYANRVHCSDGYYLDCDSYYTAYSDDKASLYSLEDGELIIFWFLTVSLNSIGIIYVIITNFGKSNKEPHLLENLNKENEIIRKQIEKRELLAKLENLEKK